MREHVFERPYAQLNGSVLPQHVGYIMSMVIRLLFRWLKRSPDSCVTSYRRKKNVYNLIKFNTSVHVIYFARSECDGVGYDNNDTNDGN